jgi:hypothetical protein
MTTKFRITAERRLTPSNITVIVYDTKKAMMTACRAYDERWGIKQKASWYAAGLAVTSSTDSYHVSKAGNRVFEPKKHIIIRFWKRHLGTEVVSHEAAHAAVRIYKGRRQQLRSIDHEEDLCYLVGEISRKIVNKLYDKGIWV